VAPHLGVETDGGVIRRHQGVAVRAQLQPQQTGSRQCYEKEEGGDHPPGVADRVGGQTVEAERGAEGGFHPSLYIH
jgi:hypothetical protein